MSDPRQLPRSLHPCPSRQCTRQVALQNAYCCTECRTAWESTPRYEPDSHSAGCDQRHAERQATATT
ncbi:hypothetical protein OG423_14195 [Micromonospora zamorensis]|uniref:hypothetical protein n=1 Tax=Micromonospora zamorensis TaxID=709883 RepID=UPI00352A32F2|nr:hypothetical protein OG423_14195 [Micromonospora zamorensis]